uniref:SFRICE_030011 n=1 Tax=Spodoptera frugiperda TaxID=7108 RepID=A0A2H1W6Z0_SPOFR
MLRRFPNAVHPSWFSRVDSTGSPVPGIHIRQQFRRIVLPTDIKGLSLLLQLCQNGRSLGSARGMELYNLHNSVPLALLNCVFIKKISPNTKV